jgi:hypothetical protein
LLPFVKKARPLIPLNNAMKNGETSEREIHRTGRLVPNHQDPVWVQCKEYRCLAYLDKTGKWVNFYTGKKLTHFVKMIG